jgi:hypothetical protein
VAIPAVIFAIIYFLTSKSRTQVLRIFLTAVYMVIGMCIIVFTGMLMDFISQGSNNDMTSPVNMVIPEIIALIGFAAIITWHKRKGIL